MARRLGNGGLNERMQALHHGVAVGLTRAAKWSSLNSLSRRPSQTQAGSCGTRSQLVLQLLHEVAVPSQPPGKPAHRGPRPTGDRASRRWRLRWPLVDGCASTSVPKAQCELSRLQPCSAVRGLDRTLRIVEAALLQKTARYTARHVHPAAAVVLVRRHYPNRTGWAAAVGPASPPRGEPPGSGCMGAFMVTCIARTIRCGCAGGGPRRSGKLLPDDLRAPAPGSRLKSRRFLTNPDLSLRGSAGG